jgi:Dolichyl-phosphate-mannose-protein mannosyltransferase
MSGAARVGLVAAAVALQVGLSVHAMRGSSATFDEGAHLPAGYTHLALLDHRLNPEQPPLVKLLAAAPLVALGPEVKTTDVSWIEARQWEFGRRFLYRWNDGDRLLFLGRLPVVALAACLVIAVFLIAERRFGATEAVAAALLAAFSPDVLAHGSLVTTDLAFALFFFLSVVATERLLEQATARRLCAAGLATGAAFATKFSAPILLLVFAAFALRVVLRSRPLETALVGEAHEVKAKLARVAHVFGWLAAVGALSLLVVWSSYGFHGRLSSNPAVRDELRRPLVSEQAGLLRSAVAWAGRARLVPEDFSRGLLFVTEHSAARPTFLLGERRDSGFPYYFAVTFLLKTPVPLLLLAALALFRIPRLLRREAFLLWLPVAVYLAATATRGLQIGHRHLLPIYPFLFVAAGEAAAALVAWRAPKGAWLAGALSLWYAGGTLLQHPHHLAYFNEIAGGSRNGWRLLVDSNLDWGQDLKRLAEWTRANHVGKLKLSYFGSADPAYYGIDSEALPGYTSPHAARVTREIEPGDTVAVSATNLQGVYLDPEDRPLMEKLRGLTPVARIGYSIFVYRPDFAWPPPGASPAP